MTVCCGNFGTAKERGCFKWADVQSRVKEIKKRETNVNIYSQICFPWVSVDLRTVLTNLTLGANKFIPL